MRDQIKANSLREALSPPLLHESQLYIDNNGGLASIPENGNLIGTHSWAIKGLLHDKICQFMINPHISALFFPIVKYMGTPVAAMIGNQRSQIDSPMLNWMAICKFDDPEKSSPTFLPAKYLQSSNWIQANSESLSWELDGLNQAIHEVLPSSVDWFKRHETEFMSSRHSS